MQKKFLAGLLVPVEFIVKRVSMCCVVLCCVVLCSGIVSGSEIQSRDILYLLKDFLHLKTFSLQTFNVRLYSLVIGENCQGFCGQILVFLPHRFGKSTIFLGDFASACSLPYLSADRADSQRNRRPVAFSSSSSPKDHTLEKPTLQHHPDQWVSHPRWVARSRFWGKSYVFV